jgi:hypothetical protein
MVHVSGPGKKPVTIRIGNRRHRPYDEHMKMQQAVEIVQRLLFEAHGRGEALVVTFWPQGT